MKLFSTLISLIVLLNVIAPMPTHDCASHSTEQNEGEHESKDKEKSDCCHHEKENCPTEDNETQTCTNDCDCGCCAVLSIIPTHIQSSIAYIYFDKDNFIYKENNTKNTTNAIWHPPQVAARQAYFFNI